MNQKLSKYGKLVAYADGLLWGYAYDVDCLHERLIVEVLADDYPIALVRAESFLPELQTQAVGDYCYGFWVSIPATKRYHVSRLTARIANTSIWLEGVCHPNQPPKQAAPVLGRVLNHHGLRVFGWAWNPRTPDQPVTVVIESEGQLLAKVLACQKQPELLEQGIGNGRHGFSVTLPLHFADGKPHSVYVSTEDGHFLAGSPLTVVSAPAGWQAWSKTHPELQAFAQQYQAYVPVSLDFECYDAWQRWFAPLPITQTTSPEFLVLISGEGRADDTLASLLAQTYPAVRLLLRGQSNCTDPRLECVSAKDWPTALRQRLARHDGLLSFVDAGDCLPAYALSVAAAVFDVAEVQLAYSDCLYQQPWFKPDWDLDVFLAHYPLHHLFVVRSGILPLDSPWLAATDAWPWLAVAQLGDNSAAIRHIPEILYHRKADAQPPECAAISQRLIPHLAPNAQAEHTREGIRTIIWQEPESWPRVSLIIPSRDQQTLLQTCIDSLLASDYPQLDIIVVDNASQEPEACRYLQQLAQQGIRVLSYPHRFNFSAINNFAVAQAQGEIIGLLNNDVAAINADWLKNMVTQLLRPNVGAVGAKLLWSNGMVQHGGVLLGLHGLAGHIGQLWEDNDLGYFGYNQITRRVSAVTAACLLCRQADYLAVGGLDEQAFPVAFNDVDFCLRLRQMGKQIIWTPYARLWHTESASRGQDDLPEKQARLLKEQHALRRRWGDVLLSDPFYNPNLNLDRYSHNGLAFPPRHRNTPLNDDF